MEHNYLFLMSQGLMWALTGLYYFSYTSSEKEMDATIQHAFRPATNKLHKLYLLLQHMQHYPPLSSEDQLCKHATYPSVASSHWKDCFKELWSYSISPIWKLFIRVNKFTVKIDLWGFIEGCGSLEEECQRKGTISLCFPCWLYHHPPGNSLCW